MARDGGLSSAEMQDAEVVLQETAADAAHPVPLPCPQNITVETGPDALALTWRWFSSAALAQVLYCLFWDILLIGLFIARPPQGALFLFLLIAVIIFGVVSAHYHTLAAFVNQTVVCVTWDEISIRHTPLPARMNRAVRTADLKRLGCQQVATRIGKPRTTGYALIAVLQDGKHLPLVFLPTQNEAHFVQQAIEGWLGTPAPVL